MSRGHSRTFVYFEMVAAMAAVIYDMVMGLIDPPACGNVNNQTAKSFLHPVIFIPVLIVESPRVKSKFRSGSTNLQSF